MRSCILLRYAAAARCDSRECVVSERCGGPERLLLEHVYNYLGSPIAVVVPRIVRLCDPRYNPFKSKIIRAWNAGSSQSAAEEGWRGQSNCGGIPERCKPVCPRGNCKRNGAEGGIRTPTPYGATPSRWCVCQFRHFRTGVRGDDSSLSANCEQAHGRK